LGVAALTGVRGGRTDGDDGAGRDARGDGGAGGRVLVVDGAGVGAAGRGRGAAGGEEVLADAAVAALDVGIGGSLGAVALLALGDALVGCVHLLEE